MPDLWCRPVDHPAGRLRRLAVTADDLERVQRLRVGGLRTDPSGQLSCGPLSGESALVANGRYAVRIGACWLPSCACVPEFWPVGRRRPLPEPAWLHCEDDTLPGGCLCSRYDAQAARYWPRGATA